MSPVAASLPARVRAVPPAMVGTALGAAALVALAVFAGSQLGAGAIALAMPVAMAAALIRGRLHAKHRGLMPLPHIAPLTGLGNARQLRTTLAYEITRHRRHKRRL